jgi:polyisoprenoid-binding protein YceI
MFLLAGCTTTTPTQPTDDAWLLLTTPALEQQQWDLWETTQDTLLDAVSLTTKTLIPSQSSLQWEGKRVLYSYTWLVDFKEWMLQLIDNRPVGGEFVIDMTAISVANGSENLLNHIRGDDFFAVEQFPEAKISITKVQPTPDPLRFDMVADMTIKGITNPVTFTAQFNQAFTAATTQFTIDRTLWDVKFGSVNFFEGLGDKVIANEIPFAISVVLE